jgi:ADP-heptose:LPS heptosyltransferase
MGDVAMIVPVLRALTQQHPKLKVTVISRPFFEPFFQNIPNLCFFAFDPKAKNKGFLGLFPLAFAIKKLQIDAFVDLHNVLRTQLIRKILFFLNIKSVAVHKGRKDKKALTRLNNKRFKPVPTMISNHVDCLAKLGFEIDMAKMISPSKIELSPSAVKLIGKASNIMIGIAPFAQYDTKVYPLEMMQDVIKTLSENTNYTIILFGGGATEIEILNRIASPLTNVVSVAGKLKLTEELEIISRLDLMLAMDSGNGHIAAMLGTAVVTLWGATHPYAGFAPFNQPSSNSILPDLKQFPLLPTSQYGNKKVAGYEKVMHTINPQMVVDKIEEIIKRKA